MQRAISQLRALPQLVSLVLLAFGWRGIVRRIGYLLKLRSGWLARRGPISSFDDHAPLTWDHRLDTTDAATFLRALPAGRQDEVVAHAERILAGEQRLYGWMWVEAGWPHRWHVNPTTGAEYPRDHWTAISDDNPDRGDIKDVWELSRLPFTFAFARAYVLTEDDRYVEAWWTAIEDWAVNNPPNLGVNWRCGQETSLRAIALCFGLSVFGEHHATTPARRDVAHRLLGASAARVRPTVGYALSQRNNHAISELVFLISVEGPRREWCRLLLEVLEDQFYEDGSYSQQSINYQRLAIHALLWLRLVQPDLPPRLVGEIDECLARSALFLDRCHDHVSGWFPNYGANDGALLFPLDDLDQRDIRSTLELLGVDTGTPEAREPRMWLRPRLPLPEVKVDEVNSTYRTIRGPNSFLLTRIGTGRHRPVHDDQQAIELYVDGECVIVDPGSYRYSGRAPWRNPFSGIECHSVARGVCATVQRGLGRFLRAEMSPAVFLGHDFDARGGERMVTVRVASAGMSLRREIWRVEDRYQIVDRLETASLQSPMVAFRVRGAREEGFLVGKDGSLTVRTSVASLRLECDGVLGVQTPAHNRPASGWLSAHYAQLEEGLVLQASLATKSRLWVDPYRAHQQ